MTLQATTRTWLLIQLGTVLVCVGAMAVQHFQFKAELARRDVAADETAALLEQATRELALERTAAADSAAIAKRRKAAQTLREGVDHATANEDLAEYLGRVTGGGGPAASVTRAGGGAQPQPRAPTIDKRPVGGSRIRDEPPTPRPD